MDLNGQTREKLNNLRNELEKEEKEKQLKEEIIAIKTMLKKSHINNLQVEVVREALKNMKKNSVLTIKEAMTLGFDKWIK